MEVFVKEVFDVYKFGVFFLVFLKSMMFVEGIFLKVFDVGEEKQLELLFECVWQMFFEVKQVGIKYLIVVGVILFDGRKVFWFFVLKDVYMVGLFLFLEVFVEKL